MTVNHRRSRFASLLSVALVAGLSSPANAGVIPWVYDAIFGTTRYPAYSCCYSPYVVSYAPYYYGSQCSYSSGATSGVSNCGYWKPVSCNPSYGPCESVCVTPSDCCPTDWSSKPSSDSGTTNKPTWSTRKKSDPDSLPTPKETFAPRPGPRPATDDGLKSGGRSRGTRTDENKQETNEVFKPAQEDPDSVIPKRNKAPGGKVDDLFEESNDAIEKPLEKSTDGRDEATVPQRRLNLDGKIAWHVEPQRTRLPFHVKTSNATVARRMPRVETDLMPVPGRSGSLKLVKK